ncbi:hypothetical protein HU200_050713 [Digitaria exilis]|uniref:Uncharacterized protein n=1 Tax=Digitaria exilis TaxID=1010633 RepID=A0A835AU62_9POAL|nr:hypothetical protein HU200_050713 [Digitaria exilis]
MDDGSSQARGVPARAGLASTPMHASPVSLASVGSRSPTHRQAPSPARQLQAGTAKPPPPSHAARSPPICVCSAARFGANAQEIKPPRPGQFARESTGRQAGRLTNHRRCHGGRVLVNRHPARCNLIQFACRLDVRSFTGGERRVVPSMAEGLLRWWLSARQRWHRRRRRGRRTAPRLVMWGGEARVAEPGKLAGEIMVEHAGRVVCRADAFTIGRPVPVLDIEDRLEPGVTYLVVPVDRLPCAATDGLLTAASLAALSSHSSASGNGKASSSSSAPGRRRKSGRSPFEYVKDEDGRTVIRVTEEFIVRAVAGSGGGGGGGYGALCSTPELRKHYEQLVGAARGRAWSPGLETIKERKGRRLVDVVSPGRLSPVRLLGIDKGYIKLLDQAINKDQTMSCVSSSPLRRPQALFNLPTFTPWPPAGTVVAPATHDAHA